jgi:hypothetical protein
MFRPLRPSSGDNYRNDIQYVLLLKNLILLQYIHYFHGYEAIYCFLIYIYTILRKFKIYNFLHKMHIKCILSTKWFSFNLS